MILIALLQQYIFILYTHMYYTLYCVCIIYIHKKRTVFKHSHCFTINQSWLTDRSVNTGRVVRVRTSIRIWYTLTWLACKSYLSGQAYVWFVSSLWQKSIYYSRWKKITYLRSNDVSKKSYTCTPSIWYTVYTLLYYPSKYIYLITPYRAAVGRRRKKPKNTTQ